VLTPPRRRLRTVGRVKRKQVSVALAWLGFFVGFAAFCQSWGIGVEYRLLQWDEVEFCAQLTQHSRVDFVGAVFAPQATCVWETGAIELVPRLAILPTAISWFASFVILVAAVVVRPGSRYGFTLVLLPLLGGAALFTATTTYAIVGPVAVMPEREATPPHVPTAEELDGWSFLLPQPASTVRGSYESSLADTLALADGTLAAAGPIPHPWDPEHEPSFPMNSAPCRDGAQRPIFTADFDVDDSAASVSRVRASWLADGFDLDARSTSDHLVLVEATPVTGRVASIQRYDSTLRIQVSGVCGSFTP
jgi:hypothetical protein